MSSSPARKQKPRTWLVLLLLIVVAGALTAINITRTARQIELATGAPSDAQEEFYVEVLERPDLLSFFKSLPKPQKLTWARNIGAHDDPAVVRLAGRLLEDFDNEVQEALTQSLGKLARKLPAEVSKELKHPGSFQQRGVYAALQTLGREALPHVAARLQEGETRASAASYLVEVGKPSLPYLLKALNDPVADVRLVAADALGRQSAMEAVGPLTKLYQGSEGLEKLAYLSALAAIGSPESEAVLRGALDDEALRPATRVDAALGLGRSRSATAAKTLWTYAEHTDREIAHGAIDALRIAGDVGLDDRTRPLAQRLEVASEVKTARADDLIRSALASSDREVRRKAAQMAGGRPSVVAALVAALRASDGKSEGDLIDAIITALFSTAEGRRAANTVDPDSIQGAFVKRQSERVRL